MTKISPRHAAARRIAEAFPNPLDLERPEPCAPETAARLRTGYDAAWEAASAAWDELPDDGVLPSDEQALIAELESILDDGGAEQDEPPVSLSTAVAVPEAAPEDTGAPPPEPVGGTPPARVDKDSVAFSTLRHIPDEKGSSLAMVLDAAPRRGRHVHRIPPRNSRTDAAAAPAVAPVRDKRRSLWGTAAAATILIGGVAAALLFLDRNGTPASEQVADRGTDIPWIRAQAGVPNTLLARPGAVTDPAAAAAPPAAEAEPTLAAGALTPEKAEERVPQTDAVPPPPAGDVRIVTTQPVTPTEPAAPAGATTEPVAELADPAPAGVTATTWVNMRSGPRTAAPVVAVVDPGTPVDVVACENWCEVIVNGQRGFIYNDYLAGL